MFPADEDNDQARAERIERWEKRLPPPYKRAFPGDPRRVEELHGKSAKLILSTASSDAKND